MMDDLTRYPGESDSSFVERKNEWKKTCEHADAAMLRLIRSPSGADIDPVVDRFLACQDHDPRPVPWVREAEPALLKSVMAYMLLMHQSGVGTLMRLIRSCAEPEHAESDTHDITDSVFAARMEEMRTQVVRELSEKEPTKKTALRAACVTWYDQSLKAMELKDIGTRFSVSIVISLGVLIQNLSDREALYGIEN